MRRPWLAIVVLVLLGIGATTIVQARSSRIDDDLTLAFGDDTLSPCEVTPFVAPLSPRVAILVDEQPVLALASEREVIAIAPKTSPPR